MGSAKIKCAWDPDKNAGVGVVLYFHAGMNLSMEGCMHPRNKAGMAYFLGSGYDIRQHRSAVCCSRQSQYPGSKLGDEGSRHESRPLWATSMASTKLFPRNGAHDGGGGSARSARLYDHY